MIENHDETLTKISEAVLGETDQVIQLESAAGFRVAACEMVQQARTRVQIFSPDLEAACYDYEDFARALAQVANAHPISVVQILVRDASAAVKRGHRLVSLCQQITTSVKARRIAEDYRNRRECYLIADNQGVIYRADEDSYKGFANFNAIDSANRLARQFSEIWENSLPEVEFRRLMI